jgi:hypothetical protein
LAIAVRTVRSMRRLTNLAERLQGGREIKIKDYSNTPNGEI